MHAEMKLARYSSGDCSRPEFGGGEDLFFNWNLNNARVDGGSVFTAHERRSAAFNTGRIFDVCQDTFGRTEKCHAHQYDSVTSSKSL
jgi:hypothetical protein